MAIIKPSEKEVAKNRHRVSELKEKRDRMLLLQEGKNSQFWKTLKEFIVDAREMSIRNIESLFAEDSDDLAGDMAKAKQFYGTRALADSLIDLIERPDDISAGITGMIKKLESEIKEAEETGVLEKSQ